MRKLTFLAIAFAAFSFDTASANMAPVIHGLTASAPTTRQEALDILKKSGSKVDKTSTQIVFIVNRDNLDQINTMPQANYALALAEKSQASFKMRKDDYEEICKRFSLNSSQYTFTEAKNGYILLSPEVIVKLKKDIEKPNIPKRNLSSALSPID